MRIEKRPFGYRAALGAACLACAVTGALIWQVQAKAPAHGAAPYADQQTRQIKSLSSADVVALSQGRGWGFAKSAELSGFPGPLHVLELGDKLELTDEQRQGVTGIFDRMKEAAISAGKTYLAAEAKLDLAFASPEVTKAEIERLTSAAGQARAKLRAVHLKAHIETTPLLTPHQRHKYATLRGYTGDGKGAHAGHGHHKH